MKKTDLITWLNGKLADAERALRVREDMAKTWSSGSNTEWKAASYIHPSTAGRPQLSKGARLVEAERHKRIAIRCRHEVDMFRATIAALSPDPHA